MCAEACFLTLSFSSASLTGRWVRSGGARWVGGCAGEVVLSAIVGVEGAGTARWRVVELCDVMVVPIDGCLWPVRACGAAG